jgi:GT2 family glycosyltransferase/glycosyltransferase involved in cell wall biosynthesis
VSRIRRIVGRGARRFLPAGTLPRFVAVAAYRGVVHARGTFTDARRLAQRAGGGTTGLKSYAEWQKQQRSLEQSEIAESLTPFLVIIESASAGDGPLVARTKKSVSAQLGSAADVRVVRTGTRLHEAASSTTEGFVLVLHAGSILAPHALSEIAKQHRVDPAIQVVVFDSDFRAEHDRGAHPQFRPEWSPEMLLGANYIGRAFAMKASTLESAPLDVTVSDRGVWRLLLSGGFQARVVGRVPKVLMTEADRAPDATDGDAVMVRSTLAEGGESAETHVDNGIVRVRFVPDEWPSVSIVVPTRHSRTNMARLLPSLAKTDYPQFDVRIIDNGEQTADNEEWYSSNPEAVALPVTVMWWTESPFNYSRVNNAAVRATEGAIVVLLNDDTEIVDPGWLKEMVGLLLRDGVGTVGVQHLQGGGLIQHGGVTVGPGGSADNLFAGMKPGSDTLLGPTSWYRNSLAVTGACVAVRRSDYEDVNGLDERFVLCGSDVVFGLDQIIRGRRNAVVPFDIVRHFESITRGSDSAPIEDYYASYWRYHPWLMNGDPYSSPNVSPLSSVPRFKSVTDPTPVEIALTGMGRPVTKVAQSMSISEEAYALMATASVSAAQVGAVHDLHNDGPDELSIRTINWFIPDIDMPFFGGLNTAFRLADKLARENGVKNRFVVLAGKNELYVRSALAAAFPSLGAADIVFYEGRDAEIAALPSADAAVATLWLTASHVAKSENVKRKFYLVQDYEPGFYPASTMFAMAEESYRLGLYGICNTPSMHAIYTESYKGQAIAFTPAVERGIYHPDGRREKRPDEPITIFAYARDHFRNCWELVFSALSEIKRIHGDRVRIVAAGARYLPPSADFIDLGLLDYRATGALYRETDIGLTMQISRHPSYLPLELMASGVPMVAPDSTWFEWLFDDKSNSLLTMRTYADVVEKLDRLIRDEELRRKLSQGALNTIDEGHSDWDAALAGIYEYMCNPRATRGFVENTAESSIVAASNQSS